MGIDKLRRQITAEAGRLMYTRTESEYYRAKLKAARAICGRWVKPSDLPSNAEIRDEVQRVAWMFEGDARFDNLREMRLFALQMLRKLTRFQPHLIGSVLTGHIRRGSDIDIHIFTSSLEAVTQTLDEDGLRYDVERKRVRKFDEEQVYTHVHIQDRFDVELTCYLPDQINYPFRSSITGRPIERASLDELEELIGREYPDVDLDAALDDIEQQVDRFQIYRMLLIPLENVEQGKKYHPEGDALYHSLQVFSLARDESPWDEELLLAALLHDVGKGLDPLDHIAAGLEALDSHITERTAWLIENHMDAHRLHDGTIGVRARRRLKEHEDYDSLLILGRCDREGRVPGVPVPTLDEALDAIREVARLCG